MYGYTEYLWNEAEKREKIGEIKGEKRGVKKGTNKTLLKAYANMKNANATDGYICSMLGISRWKLREIKRLFNETITRETPPLT